MPGKFVIQRSSDQQFYFNLQAGNGQVILSSETYRAKPSAVKGIESVKSNAPLDKRYERKNSTPGRYSFVLKAGNGEIIGRSESYTTAAAMEKGIASVKANAPDAEVDDRT